MVATPDDKDLSGLVLSWFYAPRKLANTEKLNQGSLLIATVSQYEREIAQMVEW